MQKQSWKPPYWLIGLDFVAVILLGLGLHMHFAVESQIAKTVPSMLKLPLLVLGGGLLVAGAVLATRLVLAHLKQ